MVSSVRWIAGNTVTARPSDESFRLQISDPDVKYRLFVCFTPDNVYGLLRCNDYSHVVLNMITP